MSQRERIKARKADVIQPFQRFEGDVGSPEVQGERQAEWAGMGAVLWWWIWQELKGAIGHTTSWLSSY
jgi:hypothetical protein